MGAKKKHYSDRNGENVIHMPTPFPYAIGEDYDYLRTGILPSVSYYFFHTLVLIILRPYLFIANGLIIRGRRNLAGLRKTGFIAVSNHAHVMDCAMIGCAAGLRRMYCVTLASNFCIPVIRHLVRGLGGVPLNDSPSEVNRLFINMEIALKSGKAVLMYPEGVLVPYFSGLRPFKRGAFKLAADAGAPVLPLRVVFREPRGLRKYLRKKPFVTLDILPPVWPDASLPARERSQRLQQNCRAAMEASCGTAAPRGAYEDTYEKIPVKENYLL